MPPTPHSVRRLLIANRGEIACRIARTAKRLGMTSVAVYSDADRGAMHTRVCDEAYYLGPSPAPQSYLDIEKLIALAQRVRIDAIHPGYGFLSENPRFAQRCEESALVFVGPSSAAISAMGSKSAAKAAIANARVPVAPGYHGADQSTARLTAEALRVGFPLIVKASSGGGGKGMQIVESAGDLPAALEAAKRIARASFGDDHLLLERYFANARHVEVQLFAGADREVITLFDRDCSVQRRHQKVIEEAPAPGLRPDVREAMAEAAKKVARAVDYSSAGTVEFLLDEQQNFYFMEMNTRLQVEHPVTEMICGVDLVEWQLRTARGEPLKSFAVPLAAHGHAIEARLYAEDPSRDYLPSIGRVELLAWPDVEEGLRIDAGVETGDTVSSFYDPMLAKVIACAPTRELAIDRLIDALTRTHLTGVVSNIALLQGVLRDADFRSGSLSTSFLARKPQLARFTGRLNSADALICLGIWCCGEGRANSPQDPWADTSGFRAGAVATSEWVFDLGSVTVRALGGDDFDVRIGDEQTPVRVVHRSMNALRIEFAGALHTYDIVAHGGLLHVHSRGRDVTARLEVPENILNEAANTPAGSLVTPLPGTVVAVHIQAGDSVALGAPLAVVEAMKMEHTLTAPRAGIVARILHRVGERVAEGAVLIEMAPE